jgi:hypothetical protein
MGRLTGSVPYGAIWVFVRPGIIYTESGFANYGDMAETFLGQLLPAIPAKRCGTPEEVSQTAHGCDSQRGVVH